MKTKMGQAHFIKDLNHPVADQKLYRLDPPLRVDRVFNGARWVEYILVSAAVVPEHLSTFNGPEVLIFVANYNGSILSKVDLPGSYRGGLDHAEALRRAGYEVVEE